MLSLNNESIIYFRVNNNCVYVFCLSLEWSHPVPYNSYHSGR